MVADTADTDSIDGAPLPSKRRVSTVREWDKVDFRCKAECEARLRGDGDGVPAWEQLTDETPLQYKRFAHYRDQGHERKLVATAKASGVGVRTLNTFTRKYLWAERCLAFDNWRSTQSAEGNQEALAAKGQAPPNWGARQKVVRSDNYLLGTDMFSLARVRIDQALGRELQKDGTYKPIEAVPLKMFDKDWPAFVRMAAMLREAGIMGALAPKSTGVAAGIPQDVDTGAPLLPTDLSTVSTEELIGVIPQLRALRGGKTGATNSGSNGKNRRTGAN